MRIVLALFAAAALGVSGCAEQEWSTPATQPAQTDIVPTDRAIGQLELVATFYGPMPTGVTVSQDGRMFVNFPRWGDNVPFTVAEVRNGQSVPYPNEEINRLDRSDQANHFISVQSVIVDPRNRLWVLDTGSIEFGPTSHGGPKLVGIDLATNRIFKTILFPENVALKTTYLNDVRFDLRRGPEGMAFITDSSSEGPNGIIVVDLASGRSWRKLNDHPSTKAQPNFLPVVEGQFLMMRQMGQDQPQHITIGVDGIAISADGKRLYYCPLTSRHLYSVSTDALADETMGYDQVAATVEDLGPKGGGSDGLESDDQGRVYVTDYENNAIHRWRPGDRRYETLVHDPRILWPDTLSVATNGYLYYTVNQLHRMPRYHWGADQRQKPYGVFRTPIDAGPVLLR